MLSLKTALEHGGRVWWVAPSYPQSSMAWRELTALARQIPGRQVRESDRRIVLPGGGEIAVKSADAPESLRGEGLDLVVVDEAAYVDEAVWTDALRPALSDRQGGALLISTPFGYNWFHAVYMRGQEGRGDWMSWCYPTSDNPLIPPDEIDAARETLPERTFRQEYEAQFTDDAGSVFRNVRACATATPQGEAHDGHQYVFGVDWGRTNDATAIAVVDATSRELVILDRFTQIEYAIQAGRLQALYERFHPTTIIAEQNSMGGPLIELLSRGGLPIQPFVTSNATKAQIIDGLTLAFERRSLRIIPDPVLLAELAAFAMERLPSGLIRYAARAGHDDCVMALAIAWSGASAEVATGFSFSYERRESPRRRLGVTGTR
jgi:phage FluMu gp28-like protein